MSSLNDYLNLITSQYQGKSNYTQVVSTSCQPFVDNLKSFNKIPRLYDLTTATGSCLDVIGQWVGVSRQLNEPIVGVYFSFDDEAVGFDAGVWKGPLDPETGITNLPDEFYRLAINAKILNNNWDGTIDSAYNITEVLFNSLGYDMFIEDKADLTMNLGLVTLVSIVPLTMALFTSGKFNIKPIGVQIGSYITQYTPGKIFAFDLQTDYLGGFDEAQWAKIQSA